MPLTDSVHKSLPVKLEGVLYENVPVLALLGLVVAPWLKTTEFATLTGATDTVMPLFVSPEEALSAAGDCEIVIPVMNPSKTGHLPRVG